MQDVDVNSTAEAIYVRALKWDFNGANAYTCKNIPDSIKDKLKDIFEKWQIGYYGDRIDCKGSNVNITVFAKQFKRVNFRVEKLAPETK